MLNFVRLIGGLSEIRAGRWQRGSGARGRSMAARECSSYCRIYYDLLLWILVILLHYRVLTVRRSGNGHLVPSSCLVRPTMCCVSSCIQQSTATHSINTTQSNQQLIRPSSSKDQTSLTSGAGKLQMRVRRPDATSARRTPSAPESPLQQGTATNSSNIFVATPHAQRSHTMAYSTNTSTDTSVSKVFAVTWRVASG